MASIALGAYGWHALDTNVIQVMQKDVSMGREPRAPSVECPRTIAPFIGATP